MFYLLRLRHLSFIFMLLILFVCLIGAPTHANERQDYLNDSLLNACWGGHPEEVRQLIARGADVNAQREKYHSTPLLNAVEEDHLDVVRLLIAHGAKVNLPESQDWTPLMYAAANGKEEMVKVLLDAGADPNALSTRTRNTALSLSDVKIARLLHSAGVKEHLWEDVRMQDVPGARALLAKGVSAGERDPFGETALMYAVQGGNLELFNLLLTHGADPNAQDPHGKTVLMYYAGSYHRHESDPMAEILLKHIPQIDSHDENGMTALMYASGDPRIVKTLLDHGANIRARDNQGRTALMFAVDWHYHAEAGGWESHGAAVSLLLKRGAEVDARDQKGRTALLIATGNRQDMSTVATLLDAGAKPNISDKQGTTPLMWAARLGNAKQIRALRTAGATVGLMEAQLLNDNVNLNAALKQNPDVNLRGPYGRTALMIAAQQGDIALTERLLALGAKIDVLDDFGLTALHMAVGGDGWGWADRHSGMSSPDGPPQKTTLKDCPALLRLLIAHGAPVDVLDKGNATPLMWAAHWGFTDDVQVLLESGAATKESRGAVPLADAQRASHDAVVRLLIEHGVSADTRNDDRIRSPLLVMAIDAHDAAQVSFLLTHHADVNCRDFSGATPLMHAAEKGFLDLVRTLLAAHADTHLKDYDDQTALDYANQQHHPEISALLR